EGGVDAGGARQHVAHEAFVSGNVDYARLHVVSERQRREPQIDRDAATLLLLPAVGVDPGEGLHQGGLAVVDVARGADYEAAEGIGVGVGGTHARRSQKSRAERGPASPRW